MNIKLLEKIVEIQNSSNDYISFEAALYMHGIISSPPEKIIIVGNRRRRTRIIESTEIAFVYHKADRPSETSTIDYRGHKLLVATVNQALVDIVSDQHVISSTDLIPRLFCRPLSSFEALLKLARQTGLATFKRILFFALWSGQVSLDQCQKQKIPRTPIQIFINSDGEMIWERNLKVFFPPWLLDFQPADNLPERSENRSEWLNLRFYKPFVNYMKRNNWLAIKGDASKKSGELMRDFCENEFKRILSSDTALFVRELAGITAIKNENSLPVILSRELAKRSDLIVEFKETISRQVLKSLSEECNENFEAAVLISPEIGLVEEALVEICRKTGQIFVSGFCRGILELVKAAEKKTAIVPVQARILCARICARNGDFIEAELHLASARKIAELSEDSLVDLDFAAGVIARHAGKTRDAVNYFERAAERSVLKSQPERLAAIISATGNAWFSFGELEKARMLYLKAYNLCRHRRDSLQNANLKTNLGFVEFKAGDFRKACLYFTRAAVAQRRLKNYQGEIVSLLSLAKVRIATGRVASCFDILKKLDTFDISSFSSALLESEAIKKWACEISGRPLLNSGQCRFDFQKSTHTDVVATAFLVDYFHALCLLARGYFNDAESCLNKLCDWCQTKDISFDEIAFALFYKSLAQFSLKNPKTADTLTESLKMLAKRKEHPLTMLAEVFAATAFPAVFSGISITDKCRAITRSGYYEPLWPLLAELLWNFSSESREFIKKQIELSDKDFLAVMSNRLPALSRILKKKLSHDTKRVYRLLSNESETSLKANDYEIWQKKSEEGILKIDMVSGLTRNDGNRLKFNPDTVPFRIMKVLFKSWPEPVSCREVYSTVWGSVYDPDTDWATMKTAFCRLRKLLRSISPLCEIFADGCEGPVQIVLNLKFEAVI